MKKGYWIVAYRSVSEESAVKAYGALAGPAIEPLGGRLLTRSASRVRAHESGLQQRTVVIEFESFDTAVAAYESEAYKKRFRRSVPVRNVTFVSSKAHRLFLKQAILVNQRLALSP